MTTTTTRRPTTRVESKRPSGRAGRTPRGPAGRGPRRGSPIQGNGGCSYAIPRAAAALVVLLAQAIAVAYKIRRAS